MHNKTRRDILLAIPSVLICAAVPQRAFAQQLQATLGDEIMVYRYKMDQYNRAHEEFERLAEPYWSRVKEMRHARIHRLRPGVRFTLNDYVLTQPPVYTGPAEPIDPMQTEPPPVQHTIPVVADFLLSAKQEFDFTPQLPRDEHEYKRAYAAVAKAAGLTKDQVVRIYCFESGGNGKYNVQAGLEYDHEGAYAISTALGYNQLLLADTIELLTEFGDEFVSALHLKISARSGEVRKKLEHKIAKLREMVTFCRSVPNEWNAHVRLGRSEKGKAIQALILDVEIGPLIQVRRLTSYIAYARSHGYDEPLDAAELELMNLSGEGNGLDMIIMSPEMRPQVPAANYFERNGYEANRVVHRKTVKGLLDATNAVMDREVVLQGARDLASFF